jgi:FkbM family methyltransferase
VIKALPLSQVERGLRVTIIPAAVVDKTGPVSFLVGPSGGMGKAQGSAGRQEIAYRGTINVSGISLDEFVYQQGHPPPQLVKMDIEGGEALALPGMRRILQQYHPIVLLELHGPGAAQVAWAELQAAGYRLCRMQPGFPSVPSLEALDWKAYLAAF